jgi:YVTN family beta-propeller protein
MVYRLLIATALVTLSVMSASAQALTLQKLADYSLPGDTSRYDCLSFDPTSNRMYVAHLGQGVIHVFDTQAKKLVGTVEGVAGVHGVLAVPELGLVYATATNDNTVKVIDPQSLAVIATIPGGNYPDGIAYAPTVGKLYVSDERGGTDTVIASATNEVVATIALGGEAGNTAFDAGSGQIYVAVQTQNQLVVIDPASDTVVALVDMPGCVSPHGLIIDAEHRLAFVGCQGNARVAVVDLDSRQVLSLQGVGTTPDVLVYEPEHRNLYVAAEDGIVSLFSEDILERGKLRLITNPNAGPNAHSIGLDTTTRHVYVPTANILGAPVLREFSIEALPEPDD